MESVKKIDIHAHASAFPQYAPPHPAVGLSMVSAEDGIDFYDKLNIEKGILLPLSAPEAQPQIMTSEACKWIVDQHPDRFDWFCGVDPRMMQYSPKSDLSHLLNHYKALGAKGVGELTATLPADSPMMDNLFHHCEECDMPVMIHIAHKLEDCYGILDDKGLPRIERMLKKHRNMKLIGHSQSFWAEISGTLTEEERSGYPTGKVTEGTLTRLMREYDNLYCDLSAGSGYNAMSRDPEFTARFVEEFADRIMYGVDICHRTNVHPYKMDAFLTKMVQDGYISFTNYKKIVRENAIRILKLS